MATEQLRIPKATAKRLPLYYRFLKIYINLENSVFHRLN